MTLSGNAALRLAALVIVFAVVQTSAVASLRLFGGSADLVPLLVGAVGLFAGAVPGAVTGFCLGLLLDLLLAQSVGASSLVLTLVGYGVGRVDLRDPAHGLIPVPVAAAATAAYGIGLGLVSFLLDRTSVSPLVFRDILLTVVLNCLLALPVFALVRRVLRPTLAADMLERRRRRRGPRETGPIGLRGLEI